MPTTSSTTQTIRSRIPVMTSCYLLVSKCDDRIETRRAAGGLDAEEKADGHGKPDGQYDRIDADRGAHDPAVIDAHGDGRAQRQPDHAAGRAQRQRLDQKLEQDIALARAQGLAQSD